MRGYNSLPTRILKDMSRPTRLKRVAVREQGPTRGQITHKKGRNDE